MSTMPLFSMLELCYGIGCELRVKIVFERMTVSSKPPRRWSKMEKSRKRITPKGDCLDSTV